MAEFSTRGSMNGQRFAFPRLVLGGLIVLILVGAVLAGAMAADSSAHHDLAIFLLPEQSKLEGRDRIRIRPSTRGSVELLLASRARVQVLQLNGRDHPYRISSGRLIIDLDLPASTTALELTIHYACRFDDLAPLRPDNTDNPGYGVSGTISPQGTFILSGAGWYPRVVGARESFELVVDGPEGTVAVTTGRLLEIVHHAQRTLSRWRIDNPVDGLSLSAGPYVIDRRTVNDVSVATYFSPENRHLASRYLAASQRYLQQYSQLFGDYPFDGFAVVENFFPTGYGFPGYTLIGGSVLRLPFIPETSLPHEIVHNWWGNGVRVDYSSGNWSEGLTSYTADYLVKEAISPDAARDYRLQALRNYASLVSETSDLPLSRFQSRTDPATKALGYDKSAMVFHMLRQTVGETAFWGSLQDFYRQFLFKRASWQDLQVCFERRSGQSLDPFFRQWVARSGAPRIRMEDVQAVSTQRGYRTTGRLVQEKPYYDVTVELVLDTSGGSSRQTVQLSGRQMHVDFLSDRPPLALAADPDHHLFRRLTPEEMPPTVNRLKGSPSVLLVISNRLGRHGDSIARLFSRSMGWSEVQSVDEGGFSDAAAANSDLVFIGLPENPAATRLLPREPQLGGKAVELAGQRFDQPQDVLFLVSRHPDRSERVLALLHLLEPFGADEAARKIHHYGRYSYLAFRDGKIEAKGTWDVNDSPMMVRWNPLNHHGRTAEP